MTISILEFEIRDKDNRVLGNRSYSKWCYKSGQTLIKGLLLKDLEGLVGVCGTKNKRQRLIVAIPPD